LLGAPGPVQAANAAPDAASDTAPTSAGAASIAVIEFREVNLADMCCLLWLSVIAVPFAVTRADPAWPAKRLALL
jgi:hypothetical protein